HGPTPPSAIPSSSSTIPPSARAPRRNPTNIEGPASFLDPTTIPRTPGRNGCHSTRFHPTFVGMTTLLIVHHTVSPAVHAMFEAVHRGATDPSIEGVDVVVRPALAATAIDVLEADGYLLGAPANLGYIAGALKHFFDQIYYPCLEATVR